MMPADVIEPAVRAVLERVAAADPDGGVRGMAARALGGVRRSGVPEASGRRAVGVSCRGTARMAPARRGPG
jgi:hypothetical protein